MRNSVVIRSVRRFNCSTCQEIVSTKYSPKTHITSAYHMKKILLTIACTATMLALGALSMLSDAQSTGFSTDYNEFVDQMDDVFKTTGDKKKAADFIKQLRAYMADPNTDEILKNRIISDCNRLRAAKGRPFPNYYTCAQTYMMMDGNKKIEGANRAAWFAAADAKLAGKQRMLNKMGTFYTATQDYMDDYTLKRTPAVRWRYGECGASMRAEGEQLIIDIPTTRLVCISQGDSIEVLETRGTYYFDDARWEGDEGEVTWERCKLPRAQTNAKFGEYKIDMTKNAFEVENVTFVNTDYFAHPLYGTLEHKVTSRKTTLGNLYPKFHTTGERMEIKQIFKDIDYKGGFTQIGSSFLGSSTADQPAELDIYRKDTLFVVAKAGSFVFHPDKIESLQARIQIILDDEEITHQGLHFRYMDKKREVHMIRNNDGIARSLYYDSFHQVSMDIEYMRWRLDETEIELRMIDGAAKGYSLFESLSFYRENEYYRIQGMEMTHPFQHLADFWRYNGGQPFYLDDYAAYRMLPIAELRQQMFDYSFNSFIDFDSESGLITPKPRMFDYLQFRLGKKDYDVIKFESATEGNTPNGVLDLKNYDIRLNGVRGIAISDHQNVALYPTGGKVILKRNRDFKFDGRVDAGMLSLVGSGFYFSYENYRIELHQIDKLQLKVLSSDRDANGLPMLANVGNTISDLSGYLEIDQPDNKSGNKFYPKYPKLTSTKESYVYYDAPEIHDGQYKRDVFYFAVDPFVYEDINDIRPDNTNFAGVLHSGIFPPIRHDLTIRKHDLSLGFETETPPEGYPAYGGRATFYNKVDLSNRGLHGTGDLAYVTSRSSSQDFLFLPQETTGTTYDFTITKTTTGVTFPGVELGQKQSYGEGRTGETEICYRPMMDEMRVANTRGDFMMFPNPQAKSGGYDCTLTGELTVTPSGLKGIGRTDMMMAKLEGEIMEFSDHTITADTSYFATYAIDNTDVDEPLTGALRRTLIKDYSRDAGRLYSTTSAKHDKEHNYQNSSLREEGIIHDIWDADRSIYGMLMANSMVSVIDFEKREGYFTYKSGSGSLWTSKSVKYQTQLKRMTWDMERNLQIMGQKGSAGNRFVCTKESRDSLQFNVPVAIFDGNENTLTCEEVKNIRTADANIVLDPKALVVIRKNAEMDPLDKSVIELKTDSTYHKIYDAKVRIEGAKKYTGIGNWDFVNKMGDKHTVFMGNIGTDKEARTTAVGSVGEDITFDEHFAYKGNISITTARQLADFEGGAKLIHNSKYGPTGYVRFHSVIDPQKVLIPIGEKITNWKDDEIHRSFFLRKDSTHAYSSFIESRKDHSDIEMLRAEGQLHYNNTLQHFEILSEEKRLDGNVRGTVLSFAPASDQVEGFGKIDLGVMVPDTKPVVFESAGNIYDNRSNDSISANVMSNVYFFFGNQLATMIYNNIRVSNTQTCDSASYRYERRLEEIYDTTEMRYIKNTRHLALDKETHLLPEEGPVFTFDNMNLVWNTPKRAYICDGTVNLMMMMGRNVNKQVKMKTEILPRKTGSIVDIYFECDEQWYYFGYKGGNLQVLSSDKEFNQTLQKIDPKERRSKTRGLVYTLAPDSKRKRYLAQFGPKKVAAAAVDDEETEDEESTETEEAMEGEE